jgi:ABC-2 type transport system ATP-binding protein
MDEADRVADRVAIMDHGKLLTLDTPEALKRRLGEGDVLEIALVGSQPIERAVEAILPIMPGVSAANGTIVMRGRRVVEALPAILEAVRRAGFSTGEIWLRENTLEDVFLALTGRRLRE